MALLIDGEELNAQFRQALMRDFDTANARRLEFGADGTASPPKATDLVHPRGAAPWECVAGTA